MNDFRVLIVRNRLKAQIVDDWELVQAYERAQMDIRISARIVSTDLDLDFKSFGIRTMSGGRKKEMYGLDDVKDQLRAIPDLVPKDFYHAVIFVYDLHATNWFRDHAPKQHSLGHWTRWKEIHPGTEFIEMWTTEGMDFVKDPVRVMTHELRHAYKNRLRRQGIAVRDVMDMTPVEVDCKTKKPDPKGKCIEDIPYYKEGDTYAVDGNRARANKILRPYVKEICTHHRTAIYVTYLQVLVNMMKRAVGLAKEIEEAKIGTQSRLPEWARAIKEYEGWFVGSRSYRNNNPGNLRWSPTQIGTDSGNFAIFKTYDEGWDALIHQLRIAADGTSKIYNSHMTLTQFFKLYAPSSDNNHPEKYAAFVARKLGVSVTTRIKDLL